jgi:hypothetical protein
VFRAWTAWTALRRPYSAPVTSEWDYVLLPSVDDLWYVFLLLGDTPRWSVVLLDEAHPPPTGRAGVRGDLEEGGAIHLVIDGTTWVGGSPVVRVDDELLEEVTGELRDRLSPGGRFHA